MVASFHRPEDWDIKDFWMGACDKDGVSISPNKGTLSGWITAFCFWNHK